MSEQTNTNPEQLIIGSISSHVCATLDSIERHICGSDEVTADYLLDQMKTFVFQSQLSYQEHFPLVHQSMGVVRQLIYRAVLNFHSDDFLLVLRYIRSEISSFGHKSTLLGAA